MEIETEILVENSKRKPEKPKVFIDAGRLKAYLIYDWQDDVSYKYFQDKVNRKIKAIPVRELGFIRQRQKAFGQHFLVQVDKERIPKARATSLDSEDGFLQFPNKEKNLQKTTDQKRRLMLNVYYTS